MKKHLADNGLFYLLAITLAVALKQHYSTASAADLQWVLSPLAGLVSLLASVRFAFVEGAGYVHEASNLVIAPACAGVNFMIACFCMLAFTFTDRVRSLSAKAGVLALSGLVAYGSSLVVNAARVILSILSPGRAVAAGILTPERLHRLEGVCIYFLALSLLYLAGEGMVRRLEGVKGERRRREDAAPSRGLRLLIPLFWYVTLAVVIPLLRGSFTHDPQRFFEHCLVVVLVPSCVVFTVWVVRRMCGRFATASPAWLAAGVVTCLLPIGAFCVWDPGPTSTASFNRGSNGLWIGARWYTGRDAPGAGPVSPDHMEGLLRTLRDNHIRYAYVRAGRILSSGELEHLPGRQFFELKDRATDIVFLPWLAGHADELPLDDPRWRDRVVQSMGRLYAAGVDGVHLNLEPIRDDHPGYVELLRAIGDRFEGDFVVSHATRRVAPLGSSHAVMRDFSWSRGFYQRTMQASDQTVLMGYNTMLRSTKLYCAYMGHQTRWLLDWASEVPGHQVLVGIPAYEHAPGLCDPRVENVPHALAGVRAALEERSAVPACFEGVSIYANWTTTPSEWQQFRSNWPYRSGETVPATSHNLIRASCPSRARPLS